MLLVSFTAYLKSFYCYYDYLLKINKAAYMLK